MTFVSVCVQFIYFDNSVSRRGTRREIPTVSIYFVDHCRRPCHPLESISSLATHSQMFFVYSKLLLNFLM